MSPDIRRLYGDLQFASLRRVNQKREDDGITHMTSISLTDRPPRTERLYKLIDSTLAQQMVEKLLEKVAGRIRQGRCRDATLFPAGGVNTSSPLPCPILAETLGEKNVCAPLWATY